MGKIKELTLEKQKLELKIQEIELQIAALLDGQQPTPTSTPVPTATSQPTPIPTSTPNPTPEPTAPVNISVETEVGNWKNVNGSILITKTTNDTTWLLQTDKNRSYYFIRGINHLDDKNVVLTKTVDRTKLSNEHTDLGGLKPAANGDLPVKWDNLWWASNGFVRNNNGEFVKNGVIPTLPIETPPITTPTIAPVKNKIPVPMGAIFWDNWEHDYWNSPNATEDDLNRNHIGKNRLAATEWKHKFNLVPFYGEHHKPEKIQIRYNVRWDQSLGRNVYDYAEKEVTVKFDKTQADTEREIKYYVDAGFKWVCFNYYSDDSYLSNTRRQFVAMNDKLGMKMTFMIGRGKNDSEIDYITNLMTKDYWFKIDGKPVLYANNSDYSDVNKYKSSLKNKNGSDIYVVYYNFGGLPQDVSDIFPKKPNAVGSYNNTTSYGKKATDLIRSEVEDRETFLKQYRASNINLIPTLTLGMEELGLRTSLDEPRSPGCEAATLDEIKIKCELMAEFVNKNLDKVPAVLWYAGNEILEGGVSLVPKKLIDGTIDNSVLETVSRYI